MVAMSRVVVGRVRGGEGGGGGLPWIHDKWYNKTLQNSNIRE